jgi:hypothetical protein
MFETRFPLGLQDTFVNSWGFMNLTLPVLAAMPPLDVAWRVVAWPLRWVFQDNDPVFFPTESIPTRFLGVNVGGSRLHFNEEVGWLLLNGDPGLELITRLFDLDPEGLDELTFRQDADPAWWWQINLYLGKGFGTQNTLLHSRVRLGLDAGLSGGGLARADADLNLWEYAGSFRYNLLKGGWQPYLKLGYGWTWYRVEGLALDGEDLAYSQGEWIHQPSFKSLRAMLPNSWNTGAGMEVFLLRGPGPFPRGLDLSLALEISYTRNDLGIEDWLLLLSADDLRSNRSPSVVMQRWTTSLGLTLGF